MKLPLSFVIDAEIRGTPSRKAKRISFDCALAAVTMSNKAGIDEQIVEQKRADAAQ
jgi:hypothetical protein